MIHFVRYCDTFCDSIVIILEPEVEVLFWFYSGIEAASMAVDSILAQLTWTRTHPPPRTMQMLPGARPWCADTAPLLVASRCEGAGNGGVCVCVCVCQGEERVVACIVVVGAEAW